MADDLDFSSLDGVDNIDWSDVESELAQNKDMINAEAGGGDDAEIGSGAAAAPVQAPSQVGVDFLMDIPLKLRVEVGKSTMYIKDVLNLDHESIVELNKNVGTPMDVFLNNRLVAKGEVVIQNEKFGIRITEIMTEEQRLDALK